MKRFHFLWILPLILSFSAAATSQEVTLEAPDEFSEIVSLAWSREGGVIAGAKGTEGQIVIWNVKDGKIRVILKGEGDPHLDWLSFSSDGKTLVGVMSDPGTVYLWSMNSGRLSRTFSLGGKVYIHDGYARISIGGRGKLISVVYESKELIEGRAVKQGGALAVWNLKTGRQRWKKPELFAQSLAVSPNGRTLVITTATPSRFRFLGTKPTWDLQEPHIRVLSISSGKEMLAAAIDGALPQRVALSPYGKKIFGLGFKKLTVWDPKTLQVTGGIDWAQGHTRLLSFAFSEDGKSVARAGDLWADVSEIDGGKVISHRTTSAPHFWSNITFSPDLKRMACFRPGPITLNLLQNK